MLTNIANGNLVKQPVQYVQPFNVVNPGQPSLPLHTNMQPQPQPQLLIQQSQETDEDVGYRSLTRDDTQLIQNNSNKNAHLDSRNSLKGYHRL